MKTNTQTVNSGVSGAPLILFRAEAALVFILSILFSVRTAASWWRFAALLLVPDISMAGYWLAPRRGAVAYNVAHSYIGPLVLASFAVVSSHPRLSPYLFIWIAHIAMDRALGYGLKYTSGFKRTHLGWMGA